MVVDARLVNRQLRERTRYLRSLVKSIDQFIEWMDAEMKKPSSVDRGQRIARATNALDYANQGVKRFALSRPPRKRTVRPK